MLRAVGFLLQDSQHPLARAELVLRRPVIVANEALVELLPIHDTLLDEVFRDVAHRYTIVNVRH